MPVWGQKMNASITQCPECATRFKVSDEQLAAHHGMVRCGRCSAVFKATEYQHSDEPSPQLTLPIEAPVADAEMPTESLALDSVAVSAASIAVEPEQQLEHTFSLSEEPAEVVVLPLPQPRKWPWWLAIGVFTLLLLAQILFFYRVEISAQLPGLKPVLNSYCGVLHCTIPLPKKADLMSIESSDLEADPLQTNVITLSALLHNRAGHVQAYPSLELSLTDLQDKIVARRIFVPAEYLKAGEDEKLGLAANREMTVRLRLDTTDLKPSGYKLFLFYPQ